MKTTITDITTSDAEVLNTTITVRSPLSITEYEDRIIFLTEGSDAAGSYCLIA